MGFFVELSERFGLAFSGQIGKLELPVYDSRTVSGNMIELASGIVNLGLQFGARLVLK